MKVYLVFDILNGKVVWGKGGNRENYREVHLESELMRRMNIHNSNPIELVEILKPKKIYFADLNAIMGFERNSKLIRDIAGRVDEIIADCGFKNTEEVLDFKKEFKAYPVLGTETFDITKISELNEKDFFVSVDIKESILDASNKFVGFEEILRYLNSFRIRGVIILTLKNVGMETSIDIGIVERALEVSNNPVLIGGGIKDVGDLEIAEKIGCDGVLVATSVHRMKVPLEIIKKGVFS